MKLSSAKNKGKITESQTTSLVSGAESEATKPFVKKNFIYMGISLIIIIVGFLLMTGSANTDPNHFNSDIFSTRRIVVGPALAFIGFVAMAFAIVYSPRQKEDAEQTRIIQETDE